MKEMAARSLLIALLAMSGCGRHERPAAPPTRRPQRPAVSSTLTRGHFLLADPGGRWRWEASAASARSDEATGTGQLEGLEATYFSRGKPALRLRADKGRLNREQEIVLLEGKVKGESLLTGAKLAAEQVELHLNTQRLEARGGVRVETAAGVLSGESFSGDIGLKEIWGGGKLLAPKPEGKRR